MSGARRIFLTAAAAVLRFLARWSLFANRKLLQGSAACDRRAYPRPRNQSTGSMDSVRGRGAPP